MKNIILFLCCFLLVLPLLLLLWFDFNDFFRFLNCRLENEYNNNNALLAIVVHTKNYDEKTPTTTTRERKISRKKTNFISHEIAFICRLPIKQNQTTKKKMYTTGCACLTSVIFRLVCASFFNRFIYLYVCRLPIFAMWNILTIWEKRTVEQQKIKLFIFMHLLVLLTATLVRSCLCTQMDRVYILFVHLFVFALFLWKIKWLKCNNKYNNNPNKKNIKTDRINIHNLQSRNFEIHYGYTGTQTHTQHATINDR